MLLSVSLLLADMDMCTEAQVITSKDVAILWLHGQKHCVTHVQAPNDRATTLCRQVCMQLTNSATPGVHIHKF